MASKTFTDEELNYFRICYIVTRIVPEELRKFFKQEWDKFFKATHGEWCDTAKNANDFYSMESPRNRTRNGRLLAVMANGNTSEWDCTCLFYALLYSDSLGKSLKHSPEWKSVDALREIRNEVFAHTIDGSLKEVDFQASIQKFLIAFSTLKLDPSAIEDMKNQTSFQTDELRSVRQQLETEKKRNAELFSFCVLPPRPSHDTTERLEEVSSIYQEITKLRNAKKNETTVTYLSGNPGCGKSEMARQIGQKYFKEEAGASLRFVFTLNGFTLDTLLQSYVEFAGRLNCDQDCIASISTAKDLSKEVKISQIRGFIATRIQTYSCWLIIVDNIVDLKSVFQYLPQAGERTIGKGQILVTTQDSQSIPKSDSYTYYTSLSPGMNQEDSIALLCQVSGLESKDENTLEVARALDFQPLALACAAVYMQRVCSPGKALITWGKYLEKLRNDQREATEVAYEETSLAYPTTMTTAVKLALEREVDKDEVMMHAFQFLSFVAPDPMPLKYAVRYVKNCLPEQDDDFLAAKISSSSLVISSDDESKEVRLHQVVYHCLQNVLGERNTSKKIVFDVVLAFSDIHSFDMNKIVDIVETRKLVPHFKSIAAKLQPFVERGELSVLKRDSSFFSSIATKLQRVFKIGRRHSFVRDSPLCSNLPFVQKCLTIIGDICYTHGCYRASNTCYQITFRIQQETSDDENDPSLAVTQTHLGNSYLGLGQYEDARICLEKALSIQSNAYPDDDHPSVATTLNILSTSIRYLGLLEQAEIYLERALAIQESFYGSNHPVLSATLNNLGCTFRELGQYEKSKLYLERSLAIEERVSGEDHPNVAVRLNNLAITLQRLEQYEKDKECLERALSIDENVYGEEHPLIATRLSNLAVTYHILGQYVDAKICIEKSIAIRENLLGATYSLLAESFLVLGTVLIDMGQYKEARTCTERALAIAENTRPTMYHPIFPAIWNNLGKTFHDLGELRKAKWCFDRALSIYVSINCKRPKSAVALSNFANTLLELGQYQQAEECLNQAISLQENAHGTEHLCLTNTLRNLGRTYHRLEQYDKAKACFERAIKILYKDFDESHPKSALLLNHLGDLLRDMGQYEDAKANLQKALEIQQNLFGEDSILVAGTLKNFAKTIHAIGQQKEAELILEKVLKIQENMYDANNPYVAETLGITGEFLFDSGQYGESREYFERALSIQVQVYDEGHPLLAETRENLQRTKEKEREFLQKSSA